MSEEIWLTGWEEVGDNHTSEMVNVQNTWPAR